MDKKDLMLLKDLKNKSLEIIKKIMKINKERTDLSMKLNDINKKIHDLKVKNGIVRKRDKTIISH